MEAGGGLCLFTLTAALINDSDLERRVENKTKIKLEGRNIKIKAGVAGLRHNLHESV